MDLQPEGRVSMSGLTRVAGRLVYSEILSQEFVQGTGQVLNDEAGVSAMRACTASVPRNCRTVRFGCQVNYPLAVLHKYSAGTAFYVDINV